MATEAIDTRPAAHELVTIDIWLLSCPAACSAIASSALLELVRLAYFWACSLCVLRFSDAVLFFVTETLLDRAGSPWPIRGTGKARVAFAALFLLQLVRYDQKHRGDHFLTPQDF